MAEPAYSCLLLKLSGEALAGEQQFGIDHEILSRVAREIRETARLGVSLGVVIGGGNFFRGADWGGAGVDRATADQIGMLATLMNAVALRAALETAGQPAALLSALGPEAVAERHTRRSALAHLAAGRVVVFACGTGSPFFTTDTAAALRAREIDAQLLLKATKVDGVYDRDPVGDETATFIPSTTFDEILRRDLRVMDATAVAFCKEHRLPIVVFNLEQEGAIARVALGEQVGTAVNLDSGNGPR